MEVRQSLVLPELAKFPESAALYPKLLLRAKPERLAQFGIEDLAFRLECQAERERRAGAEPDLTKRAAIWYIIASKCSEGKSEISTPTADALLEWVVGADAVTTKTVAQTCVSCGKKMRVKHDSKFVSCRACRSTRNRRDAVSKEIERTGQIPEGWKTCIVCADPFEPKRSDALYCPKARCRKSSYRARKEARIRETNQKALEAAYSPQCV